MAFDYKGTHLNGIGRKIYIDSCGAIHVWEGQFKANVLHGFGRFMHTDGDCYIGNHKKGFRHGFGMILNPRHPDEAYRSMPGLFEFDTTGSYPREGIDLKEIVDYKFEDPIAKQVDFAKYISYPNEVINKKLSEI